jgi:LuxR family maltose regulon positive regulatory protein
LLRANLPDPVLLEGDEVAVHRVPDNVAVSSEDQPLIEPLSERELEVLALIADGLKNQEIADNLTVALSTVKTHINNIYGKLGVSSRVQAVTRAQELGLIET